MPRGGLVGAVFALLVATAVSGSAQTTGMPLRNPGVRTGLEVGVDLGFGRIDRAPPSEDETVRALAGSVALGAGPVGITGTLVRADRNNSGEDRTAVTVAAGLRVFGGPLVPLSVTWQAAATFPLGTVNSPGGSTGASERPWRGSLGIGAALSLPVPVVAITPWLSPRLDYFGRQSVTGSKVKPALAAGIDLGFLNGLVVRVAYDSRIGWEPAGAAPSGISLGAGYRVR